jgi:solute carrier family 25 (mitochondrial phosphate transporter), member 23/24/25/41
MAQGNNPSRRDNYDNILSGAQDRPSLPRLRSDPLSYHVPPHTLEEFRDQEGRENRERRLQALWKRLTIPTHRAPGCHNTLNDGRDIDRLTLEEAEALKTMYDNELLGRCGGHSSGSSVHQISWRRFKEYAEAKEVGW